MRRHSRRVLQVRAEVRDPLVVLRLIVMKPRDVRQRWARDVIRVLGIGCAIRVRGVIWVDHAVSVAAFR